MHVFLAIYNFVMLILVMFEDYREGCELGCLE
jgi:hypothetical protein